MSRNRRRLVWRVCRVAAAIAAVSVPLLVASPVAACVGDRLSALGTPRDFAAADAVFIGTVVQRDEPFSFWTWSTIDPIGWTFVVEMMEKGPAAERIRVESARDSMSCGIEFRLGERYRVFAELRSDRQALWVALGDVEQLEPLADPPPTEPGGINFVAGATILPMLGILVLVVSVSWALGDVIRRRRRKRIN